MEIPQQILTEIKEEDSKKQTCVLIFIFNIAHIITNLLSWLNVKDLDK